MNLGIHHEYTKEIANGISHVLADTYVLYLKTQNYHWNVTGARFHQLHGMFEEQYKDLAVAIDDIAERIRALGHKAPGTFKEFLHLTSMKENLSNINSTEMIEELVDGHEMISRKLKEIITMSGQYNDDVSSDLLTSRMQYHEKTAWMLRSSLER